MWQTKYALVVPKYLGVDCIEGLVDDSFVPPSQQPSVNISEIDGFLDSKFLSSMHNFKDFRTDASRILHGSIKES